MRAYTNGLSISTNNNQPEKSEMLTVMQFQAVLLVYHCLFVFWNHVTYFIRMHSKTHGPMLYGLTLFHSLSLYVDINIYILLSLVYISITP